MRSIIEKYWMDAVWYLFAGVLMPTNARNRKESRGLEEHTESAQTSQSRAYDPN